FSLGGTLAYAAPPDKVKDQASNGKEGRSAIKHVIVIVGENRTFDHLFATYEPRPGESVDNLLSKHIIKDDGTPGPKYHLAYQFKADATDSPLYQLAPQKKTLYGTLPAPINGGPTDVCVDNFFVTSGTCSLSQAMASEDGLDPDYDQFMLTGGSGLTGKVP